MLHYATAQIWVFSRTLVFQPWSSQIMKILFLCGIAAMLCLCGSALADVSGIVSATRDVQAANTSLVPQAITVGGFTRTDPTFILTKWMTEITVETADGKKIKVVQDRDPRIEVGAAVTVVTTDGQDRVVRK
jgi:hypothetical protein